MSTYIAHFNPYSMDDETILAVATGRKQPLHMVLEELEEMLLGNGETTHLLVHGPRGIGKSFFARYLQIEFNRSEIFKNCLFVLFPEEQSNIQFPGDFVRMLLSQTEEGGKFEQVFTKWEEPEADWKEAYGRLRQWIKEKQERHDKFLLVALVENMDELMQRFTGSAGGRFREMLEKLPCFVLVGATLKPDFDRDYNKPLFHLFKKYKLARWKEEDFLKYFTRRLQFEEVRTGVKFSPNRVALLEAKLKAVKLFAGGSPRMAAVLSNLLLQDDLFSTANTLRGLIDELTPYYQDLTKRIPAQSRKLFDTLIRAGENLSQTELAAKLATSQNTISRAFLWLQENDYIRGEKREGSQSFRYLVNDRIYCQYYKTREVFHDQDYSPIWLLADLLVAFYEGYELRQKSIGHLEEQFDLDTKELARVSLYARGIPRELLPSDGGKDFWMDLMEEKKPSGAAVRIAQPVLKKLAALVEADEEEPALEGLEALLPEAKKFLEKKEVGGDVASALESLGRKFMEKEFRRAALQIFEATLFFRKIEKNLKRQAANYGLIGWNLKELGHIEEALDAHQQALALLKKEGYQAGQAWNLGQIGRNLEELGRNEEALDAHRQALALREEEGDRRGQAWNLGRIGRNLEELGRNEEALDAHRQALALREEEGDRMRQVKSLNLIGRNLQKLSRREEALIAYRKALVLLEEDGNHTGQAWNLRRIGWNFQKLGRHEEALDAHRQALALLEEEGDRLEQAWNLGQIGWNLKELGRHEEALDAHRQALALRKEEGGRPGQAWSLGRIGLNLEKLGRHEDALDVYRHSLVLCEDEGDHSGRASNLGLIGWNLEKLGRHEDACDAHQQALALRLEESNHPEQSWNLGHIGKNLLLLNRNEEAWEILLKAALPKEEVFKQFGDAIIFKQEKENSAVAFTLANDLLHRLKASKDKLDLTACLIHFFANLLSLKIQESLLRDICEEALAIFPLPSHQTIIRATLATVEYVSGGKLKAHIEKLPPDTATVVEAIVREGVL